MAQLERRIISRSQVNVRQAVAVCVPGGAADEIHPTRIESPEAAFWLIKHRWATLRTLTYTDIFQIWLVSINVTAEVRWHTVQSNLSALWPYHVSITMSSTGIFFLKIYFWAFVPLIDSAVKSGTGNEREKSWGVDREQRGKDRRREESRGEEKRAEERRGNSSSFRGGE